MKISIVIPTLARDTLYPLIEKLLKQDIKYDLDINLVPQYTINTKLLNNKRINIKYEAPKKGFSYYRNIGINMSRGEIIVFIDDDELPMNNKWLESITKPIMDNKEAVVTAGVKIKLNNGYIADSISLLGFPGGGALGFEIIWPLKEKDYTDHICSGNLAIKKSILKSVGNFSEGMKFGGEDMDLGRKLIKRGFKIRYVKEATVYHVPRKGIFNFLKWSFLRGKSAGAESTLKQFLRRIVTTTKVLLIIKKQHRKYLEGAILMGIIKHLSQGAGFCFYKLNRARIWKRNYQ